MLLTLAEDELASVRAARVFEAVGQPLGDPQPLLDGDSNRMPASEVSHPPSKPTCTGLPATAGKSVRILYLPPWSTP